MKAVHIQYFLALIFLGLGSWCIAEPHVVESLVLRPDHLVLNETSKLLMACFGAQAVLCGIVLLITTFGKNAFLAFGLVGSVPFFAFNYYFYFVVEMFTDWMLLDFAGNIGILLCGILGYKLSKKETEQRRFGHF